MKAERNFTTTDIFAEHLTLTFSLDNDIAFSSYVGWDPHFGATRLFIRGPLLTALWCVKPSFFSSHFSQWTIAKGCQRSNGKATR